MIKAEGLTIELKKFSVRYPNFILHPFDLAISPGERVALIGANGAGKSTTLKAIAGRLRGFVGQVEIGGEDVRRQTPEIRQKIGFLPEELLAFGWMTVAQHLEFLSAFFPTWSKEYEDELVGLLKLPPEAKVGTLSKGMGVKLSFVVAEAPRPPLLILDEPTSAIDPLMRGELLTAIDNCAPRGGERTVLFSSHILDDVEKIADRIVFLRDGSLLDDLTVEQIKRRGGDSYFQDTLHSILKGEAGK